MKNDLDVVRAYTDSGDPEAIETLVADDFKMVDGDGNVILDKAGLYAMGRMLYDSFDDLRYVRTELRQEGNAVIMSGYWEGTHARDLDVSGMGMGVISASGRNIVWPEGTVRITVAGEKIKQEQLLGEGGGIEKFLAPLKAAQSTP